MKEIVKRLMENHEIEPEVEVSETPEEEETLEEDWRDGVFGEKELKAYSEKMTQQARDMVFSLTNMEKKHPEYAQQFKSIRFNIKKFF